MKLFVATKAVVLFEGNALVLRESGEYEDGTQRGNYDLPGGRIDPSESLFDALKREVQEETGLVVSVGDLFHVSEKFQTIRGEQCHIIRLYFICEADTDTVVLSDDHDAYEWIDPTSHATMQLIGNEHETFDIFLKKIEKASCI